jgi:hypothetical protein
MGGPPGAGGGPPGAGGPAGPPGGTGAATVPQAMAGAQQKSMTSLKIGLMAMQAALPGLEMGSELQMAVLKAVTDLSKHMSKSDGPSGGQQMQELAQMARQAQMGQQRGAMMGAMPPSPGSPGAPPPPGEAEAA